MRYLTLIISIVFSIQAFAQNVYKIKIEEDYIDPKSFMWKPANQYHKNEIKDGMYISQAAVLPSTLSFDLDLVSMQDSCFNNSDMEFFISKIKGNKEDFIRVQLSAHGYPDDPYLVFWYNELGEWKLTNYQETKLYKNGNTKVNPGNIINVIRIEHRDKEVRYYMNNELVTKTEGYKTLEIRWNRVEIYTTNKKFVLGLDKVVFTGYNNEKTMAYNVKSDFEKAKATTSEQNSPLNSVVNVIIGKSNDCFNTHGITTLSSTSKKAIEKLINSNATTRDDMKKVLAEKELTDLVKDLAFLSYDETFTDCIKAASTPDEGSTDWQALSSTFANKSFAEIEKAFQEEMLKVMQGSKKIGFYYYYLLSEAQ